MRLTATLFTALGVLAPVAAVAQSNVSDPSETLCARSVTSLRNSLKSAPQALATLAATDGDYRYLEWSGVFSAIPGITDQQCVRGGKFFKWFEGTSDALCSEEHRVLYERSYAFAEQYNLAMASLRAAKGLESCNVR